MEFHKTNKIIFRTHQLQDHPSTLLHFPPAPGHEVNKHIEKRTSLSPRAYHTIRSFTQLNELSGSSMRIIKILQGKKMTVSHSCYTTYFDLEK